MEHHQHVQMTGDRCGMTADETCAMTIVLLQSIGVVSATTLTVLQDVMKETRQLDLEPIVPAILDNQVQVIASRNR